MCALDPVSHVQDAGRWLRRPYRIYPKPKPTFGSRSGAHLYAYAFPASSKRIETRTETEVKFNQLEIPYQWKYFNIYAKYLRTKGEERTQNRQRLAGLPSENNNIEIDFIHKDVEYLHSHVECNYCIAWLLFFLFSPSHVYATSVGYANGNELRMGRHS